MTKLMILPILGLGLTVGAGAQTGANPPATKVGIVQIQSAIVSTKDGQKARTDLQGKFAPRQAELEKQQNEIAQIEDQIRKGSNTMSDEARTKLMRDRDQKATALKRGSEDLQAEVEQEEGKVMQELGQRMMAVIDKYAKDNGYTLILDVSSPQTPVLYAASGIDITADIIALYDKNAPSPAAAGAPAPKPPAMPAPKPVAPRPAAPPATKK